MATITERTSQDGSKSYRVEVRLKGHPIQRATFKRLTDAKKWVQNTESAIREGRHFKTSEAKKHTLGDAIVRYLSGQLIYCRIGRCWGMGMSCVVLGI